MANTEDIPVEPTSVVISSKESYTLNSSNQWTKWPGLKHTFSLTRQTLVTMHYTIATIGKAEYLCVRKV
jgi:hypothetical protein